MKEILLRKLHRSIGIVVAPFFVIQALSGLLLGFGLFRRGEAGPPTPGRWDLFLERIHFMPGWLSDSYHLLLGIGIFWIALSGWIIHLRSRGRTKAAADLPRER
ncbi:MAG TPA: hypothetical protein VL949_05085 [Geobacteraceae bacterium]|nr:hypothetical protein [Geobacteraceae bacterium]